MATHHCIGNPCWICHPELAPKWNDVPLNIPTKVFSVVEYHDELLDKVRELIVSVFLQGLDEDEHYRRIGDITLEDLKTIYDRFDPQCLEARLLYAMIEDFETKGGIIK